MDYSDTHHQKIVRRIFESPPQFFEEGPDYDAAIKAGFIVIQEPFEDHLRDRYYITDKGYALIGEQPNKLDPISATLIASLVVVFIGVPWAASTFAPSSWRCNAPKSTLHPLSEDFERSRINNMLTVPRPC